MLEEHQNQSWSSAEWAEHDKGLMYFGRLPCEIIMSSKDLGGLKRL